MASHETIIASCIITLGLISGFELFYISTILFRNNVHRDPNLFHIMVMTVYNLPMSVAFPVLTGLTILIPDYLRDHSTLHLIIMTVEKTILVHFVCIIFLAVLWDTVTIYFPLRAMCWKSKNYLSRSYWIILILSTVIITVRACYTLVFTDYTVETMNFVLVPQKIDAMLLLFGLIDPLLLFFVLSHVLIYRVAKKHILNTTLTNKHEKSEKQKYDLNKLTKKILFSLVLLSSVWLLYVVALHVSTFGYDYLDDHVLGYYFIAAIFFDLLSFPLIVGWNAKVQNMSVKTVKKDLKSLSRIYRCTTVEEKHIILEI